MRSQYVAVMWRNCLSGKPPALDPCKFGLDLANNWIQLRPHMLPDHVEISAEEVLKMIRFRCLVINCKKVMCAVASK